jgi:hypothetical protein
MWTLTSDNLERAKVELIERRAAAEARYAAELKAVDTDLEEIETLARFADSFSKKHTLGTDIAAESSETTSELVEIEPEEVIEVSQLETEPAEPAAPEPETAEPLSVAPTADMSTTLPNSRKDTAPKGGSSRWRIRIPTDKEMASSGV